MSEEADRSDKGASREKKGSDPPISEEPHNRERQRSQEKFGKVGSHIGQGW